MRISCSRSAIGRDAKVADDEVVVGGHGWQGSWSIGDGAGQTPSGSAVEVGWVAGCGSASAMRCGTSSARVIPSRVPLIASRIRTQSRLTEQRAVRSQASSWLGVVVLGGADHRGDRTLERAQDVGHRDLVGRPGELVAAVRAPGRHDEAGVAQAHHELLEVRPGQLLLGGDLGQAGRPGAVVATELDHQPDAVLALRREGDGAAAVELGAGAQGRVLEFRLILSGLSLPDARGGGQRGSAVAQRTLTAE